MHPNKLSSIRELRESIQKQGCIVHEEYPGPEVLEKILSAELMISEDIKTYEANFTRFQYKFYPLPLNPNTNFNKRRTAKKAEALAKGDLTEK